MESLDNNRNYLLAAEIELVYKNPVKASDRPKISSAKDAYEVLIHSWNQSEIELREVFKVILVSRANRVLGIYEVSKGGLTGVAVDVRMIFAAAIKCNASGVILAHNHPSGQLTPSSADLQLTQRIKSAGEILDITVMDHIILTSEGFMSFNMEGII